MAEQLSVQQLFEYEMWQNDITDWHCKVSLGRVKLSHEALSRIVNTVWHSILLGVILVNATLLKVVARYTFFTAFEENDHFENCCENFRWFSIFLEFVNIPRPFLTPGTWVEYQVPGRSTKFVHLHEVGWFWICTCFFSSFYGCVVMIWNNYLIFFVFSTRLNSPTRQDFLSKWNQLSWKLSDEILFFCGFTKLLAITFLQYQSQQ